MISELAVCYPQTIVHGYQNCVTCHTTNDGGDTLNDYGRGMSEAFMATWAKDGEAREMLGLGELKWLDLGLDYRTLDIRNLDTGARDEFHMYTTGQLVIRHAGLTLSSSLGLYGHDTSYQTRNYFLGYHADDDGHNVDFKLGYFMPVVGLGTNNHDLFIKKAQGFGRGQEKFVAQLSYLNSWFELRYLTAYQDFTTEKREDNFLGINAEAPPAVYYEIKFKKIEGIDAGAYLRTQGCHLSLAGASIRLGKGRSYVLGQYDQNSKDSKTTSYLRTGIFLFQGFDGYIERQTLETEAGLQEAKAIGFSWMIRPRFEYEAALSQSVQGRNFIGSLKLWL